MAGKMTCTRKYLAFFNVAVALISLGAAIAGTVFLLKARSAGALEALPEWAFIVVISFSSFVFLLSFFGFLGGYTGNRGVLWFFCIVSILTVVIQIIATVFLLMYANDKPTIDSLDTAVENAQGELEASLLKYAIEKPSEWQESQDLFSCCGIDFEATFMGKEYGMENLNFLETTLTGTKRDCASSIGNVTILQSLSNYTYDAANEALAEKSLGEDFFCKDKIRILTVESSLYLGLGSGAVVLFQLVSLVCAFMVICGPADTSVQEETGGPIVASPPPEVEAARNRRSIRDRLRPTSFF